MIKVNSLDESISLRGFWLFTREDNPTNKNIVVDTTDWKRIKTPGPWKGVYEDGQPFQVGWYRGTFQFDPSLVGKEVVLLVDTYMGELDVYLDGNNIFERPHEQNIERFYGAQARMVRFQITDVEHVVAFRVHTWLMTGVYQNPFQLRQYDPHDWTLAFFQFWGGEVRFIAAWGLLFAGLFFLLVFFKVRHSMYLVAALAGIMVFPFFFFVNDSAIKFFNPQQLFFAHYLGLSSLIFHFMFWQFFDTFKPRTNKVLGVLNIGLGMLFTIFVFGLSDSMKMFQGLRTVFFLVIELIAILTMVYTIRLAIKRKPFSILLAIGGTMMCLFGTHDFLLALGLINSTGMIFMGVIANTTVMLLVSALKFADTFVENKQLVRDLRGMNDHLEDLVSQRTAELRRKTNDVQTMLSNLPEGILTIMQDLRIHHEYSTYLETILESKKISEEPVMEVIFKHSDLNSNQLSEVQSVLNSCLGEDSMNYDFNAHLLPSEIEITTEAGTNRTVELMWSPIINDEDIVEKVLLALRDVTELKQLQSEALLQKRELEIIGQILSVAQEKFFEFISSSKEFIEANLGIIQSGEEISSETLSTLFRNMHTIKGNARTYGLHHLTNVAHETENDYDQMRKNPEFQIERETLLKKLQRTHQMIEEYAVINENKLGRKGPGRRGSVERFLMIEKDQISSLQQQLEAADWNDASTLRDLVGNIRHTLMLIGTEPLEEILGGVLESTEGLAKELDRESPTIQIQDEGIFFKNQIFGLLRNAFMHLIRNSLDHGLETSAERLEAGKSPQGTILIKVELNVDYLILTYRDDGRGLNLKKIHQKAIDNKMLAADQPTKPEDIANLIFASGLSTAAQVTEISGRGVGMDAVKKFFEREKGSVNVHLLKLAVDEDKWYPFEIIMKLPASFAVKSTKQA